MATNKNAVLRYRVLDKCFRNSAKKYHWEDLQEACNKVLMDYNGEDSGVSRRQLYKDMDFMKSEAGYSAPIERGWENRRAYYYYSDKNFSINHQPLSLTELHQVQEAVYALKRFEGLPQFGWVQELLPRLQQEALVERVHTVIGYDENRYLRGIEYITVLFNAIINEQVLEVCYKEFTSDRAEQLLLHPYFLKEYNNRWFVLGHHEKENNSFWVLALDRIVSVKEARKKYRKNPGIDWNDHFEDVIGVTKKPGKKSIKIQLWFHPKTAPYIETKPFHGSQKKISKDDKGGLAIQLDLIPNYEFYQWVLFYGDRVKVLSPKRVVNEVKKVYERALKQYGE